MKRDCCGQRLTRIDNRKSDTAQWYCSRCTRSYFQKLRKPSVKPNFRITYDFDPDTEILETNLYEDGRLVLRETIKPPKSLEVLKTIRAMKDKKDEDT